MSGLGVVQQLDEQNSQPLWQVCGRECRYESVGNMVAEPNRQTSFHQHFGNVDFIIPLTKKTNAEYRAEFAHNNRANNAHNTRAMSATR